MKRLCVFAGSSPGRRPEYAAAARSLAREIAGRGVGVVYGGGNVGLMGELAAAALEAGGHVIGVIPRALFEKEVVHDQLPDLRVVESMHERKALMAELADGFVALPGGLGTFEELCEVLTWGQLGLHAKPCGLLNIRGYYDSLAALLDHAVEERFLRAANRSMLLVENEPAALIERFEAYSPPSVEKWLDREES